jgi:hypothetical protein
MINMEDITMAETACDLKCQYANPEHASECKCECGGENHGKGTDVRRWEAKEKRHAKTRRAFRAHLNAKESKSGNKLYRRNRTEFNRLFAEWQKEHGVEPKEEIETVHKSGSEVTVIKDATVGEDVYSHVRRSNGKTEYRKNDKMITKADVPKELGW